MINVNRGLLSKIHQQDKTVCCTFKKLGWFKFTSLESTVKCSCCYQRTQVSPYNEHIKSFSFWGSVSNVMIYDQHKTSCTYTVYRFWSFVSKVTQAYTYFMNTHIHTVTPVIVKPWQSFIVPVRLLANFKRSSSVSANRLCYDARGSARLKSLSQSNSDSAFCDV